MRTFLRRQITEAAVDSQGRYSGLPSGLPPTKAFGKEAVILTLVDSYATRYIFNDGRRMVLGLAEDWRPPKA